MMQVPAAWKSDRSLPYEIFSWTTNVPRSYSETASFADRVEVARHVSWPGDRIAFGEATGRIEAIVGKRQRIREEPSIASAAWSDGTYRIVALHQGETFGVSGYRPDNAEFDRLYALCLGSPLAQVEPLFRDCGRLTSVGYGVSDTKGVHWERETTLPDFATRALLIDRIREFEFEPDPTDESLFYRDDALVSVSPDAWTLWLW